MRAVTAVGFLAGVVVLFGSSSVLQAAPYLPPAGFQRAANTFGGEAFAVAPDGKVAIGASNFAGGASIRVYASAADAQAGAVPLRVFSDAAFKSWGDLTFADGDTLLFSENADRDTVYRGLLGSGTVAPLAPVGSIPNAGGVVAIGSTVYAVAASNPGTGALYQISGGSASTALSNLGAGYLGGLAVDAAGTFLLTDTNDPTFAGNAGKLLRFSSALVPLPAIDLAGGGGAGAYDVALDSEGDAFVSTGSTLTRIAAGATLAEPFGSPFTGFPFITNLDFTGNGFEPSAGVGQLWVNAVLSDDAAIFAITPAVPEPIGFAGIATLAVGAALRRRRRPMAPCAAPLAMSLIASASVAIAPPARADQFFATEVIDRVVGAQQQAGFTDPHLALGGPRGGGTTTNSIDCYNLGNGGSLTLGFNQGEEPYGIRDGLGFDFIVFENSFYDAGDPTRAFAELAWVEVSSDGVNFARFPAFSETAAPVPAYGTIHPGEAVFFAGVRPVLANVDENELNPFDRIAAGGDPFDLLWLQGDALVTSGTVDLAHIRHVRLVDVIGDGRNLEGLGRPIYDPTGPGSGGADIDAVAVIHGTHLPEPGAALGAVAMVGVMARRRRGGRGGK